MDKRLVYPQNLNKERDLFLLKEDRNYLRKHASGYHPQISSYIEKAKPIEGLIQVLLTALAAVPYWSQNVNGDAFTVPALSHEGDDYGYRTFTSNANYFTHHVNKDPALAKGKVLFSVWNDPAKRVELIVGINPTLDSDAAAMIDRGESLCFSMGCFIAGTKIRMADYSTKNIEDIVVGDRILNSLGVEDTVTELHVRPYTGELLIIKSIGEEPLYVTPEHPLKAIKFSEISGHWPSGLKKPARTTRLAEVPPKWIGARHLEKNDFLAIPVDMTEETPDWMSTELMRFLGYYLAEGHTIKRKGKHVGVVLATHKDDPIHDEIHHILEVLKVKNPVVVREHPRHSEFIRMIEIYDERLAILAHMYCGSYASQKYLSRELMLADPKLQLQLLGAYLNGDGWQCKDKGHEGVAMFSTCSERIAYQTQILLARCGILSKINRIKHAAGIGFNYHDTVEYQVYCGISGTNILSTVSKKVTPTSRMGQKCGRRRVVGNHILTTIKEVTSIEFSGNVYNFEVKNDPSYLVSRIAAHNCKLPFDVCTICANKAKTRAEYCDHLRYMMNQIDPESGKLVGAINPYPKFFDISRVLIPADKTAYMWEKLAADGRSSVFSKLGSAHLAELPAGKIADLSYLQKVAEEKLDGRMPKSASVKRAAVQKRAEIKKQILAVQPAADAKLSALLPRIKTALDAVSPVIPSDAFAGHTLREILITILSLGMTPTAGESRTLHDLFTGGMPAGETRYSPELAKKLTPLIPHRSFAPPVLLARLQKMLTAVHGSPLHKKASVAMMRHVPRRPEHFDAGMKQGILAALAFLLAPESLKRLVLDHPIPLLMAGAPLLAAGKTLTSPEPLVSGEYDLAGGSPDLYNEDWRSRFAKLQARPVTVIKTGEDLSQTAHHMMNTWSGMSGLLGFSDLVFDGSAHAASDFGNRFPALFQNSILSKSAQEIGEVARLLKTASDLSGDSVVSFDQLPNTDRIASVDCLILQTAEKLTQLLKGENQHG